LLAKENPDPYLLLSCRVFDGSDGMVAKVLLLNDDKTTMEFVVQVREDIFEKTHEEALRLVLDIHRDGSGVCGAYASDHACRIAERVTGPADEITILCAAWWSPTQQFEIRDVLAP
jgi:ATP-dependent Clp protease adaptor protein ClpS